jgi:hypothetical protein
MIKSVMGRTYCFVKVFDDARVLIRGEPDKVELAVHLVRKIVGLPELMYEAKTADGGKKKKNKKILDGAVSFFNVFFSFFFSQFAVSNFLVEINSFFQIYFGGIE